MSGIQKTGHRDSPYERPNQRWVCGWADYGDACAFGPDGHGNCPARLECECEPRRVGDRYLCGRPAVFGGPCEIGPLPDGSCCHPTPRRAVCQPRLSLRARRGRMVWLALAATIGLLALAFGGAWRLGAISPGGLIAAHQPIPPPHGARANCAACHAAAVNGMSGWVLAAFSSGTPLRDSEKCLDCHFRGDARFALAAHSIDPKTLSASKKMPSVQGHRTASLLLASFSSKPDDLNAIPCSTCHHEHRGAINAIKHMDNTRCQACHRVVFDSFTGDHPEFGAVHHERAGILFDHRSHKNTYFGKEQPFECSRCHRLDAAGKVETTRAYETSCAGCHHAGTDDHHGAKIRGTQVVAFQLPDLGSALTGVTWSKSAPTGTQIPGLMQVLLAGDPIVRPVLGKLMDSGGDPSDWPDADDDPTLRQKLATGVEELTNDMLLDGHAWLRRQVALVLGVAGDSDKAESVTADIEDAQSSLRNDIAPLIGSVADAPSTQELAIVLTQPAASKPQVATSVRELACANSTQAVCARSASSAEAALKARDDALDGTTDATGISAGDPRVQTLFADAALAPVRLRSRIAHALDVPLDDAKIDPLLTQLGGARFAVQQWRALIDAGATPTMGATSVAAAGGAGWSVHPKDGTVVYQPTGHADPFMRAYLDAAVAVTAQPAKMLPTALHDAIRDRARSSECLRCHAVDQGDGMASVNWTSAGRDFDAIGFSNFVHGPHVDLLSQKGCDHCHAIAKDEASGKQARGLMPHHKAVCAECHNPGQINADCVTCHRYHRVAADARVASRNP